MAVQGRLSQARRGTRVALLPHRPQAKGLLELPEVS